MPPYYYLCFALLSYSLLLVCSRGFKRWCSTTSSHTSPLPCPTLPLALSSLSLWMSNQNDVQVISMYNVSVLSMSPSELPMSPLEGCALTMWWVVTICISYKGFNGEIALTWIDLMLRHGMQRNISWTPFKMTGALIYFQVRCFVYFPRYHMCWLPILFLPAFHPTFSP
jgi:hypothetical protein